MASSLDHPRATKVPNGLLLTYNLPHRVYTTIVYPLESGNGSTVIIYGHENGVRIVWRGGRPFKSQQGSVADPKKANGTGSAVVLLDSDDDEGTFEDKPEFSDESEAVDPSKPYASVLQDLDLFFGTNVLHLAVLPSSILKADGPSWSALNPLKTKLVFTAACADNVIRLVTLPLTPPSPESKARLDFRTNFTTANAGNGKWGETVKILSGHQKPSDGLSMTIDHTDHNSEPNFIIASHSREVTGLLLLYKIPIKSSKSHFEPFQTAYLASPAKSVSFSPALSKELSSQLLVAETTGICRIYDFKDTNKSLEESDTTTSDRGTWLISLYAGYQNIKPESIYHGAHAGFGRKILVDAQWISDGHAIIILLNDGEWAIWDVNGVGPGTSQGLLSRQGIKGGSKAGYSLTGYIDTSTKPKSSGPPQITSSKFAPMTPGTRKSVDPFNNRGPGAFICGQVSVIGIPSKSPTSADQESVLFWLGDTFLVIPNLAKYWAAHASKSSGGSLFSNTGAYMVKLDGINLQGERCSGIAQIPKSSSSISDIVILAEHRILLLDSGDRQTKTEKVAKLTSNRLALARVDDFPVNDAMDLSGGDLDVNGIEMALTHMENGNGAKRKLFAS